MKTCAREGCNKEFTPQRTTGKFCSVDCRNKHWNTLRSGRKTYRSKEFFSNNKNPDAFTYVAQENTFKKYIHSKIPEDNGLLFDKEIRKINGLA